MIPRTSGRASAREQPAHALRAALDCRYPRLRAAAIETLRDFIRGSDSFAHYARRLGISERAFARLRRDFPEAFLKATSASPMKRHPNL